MPMQLTKVSLGQALSDNNQITYINQDIYKGQYMAFSSIEKYHPELAHFFSKKYFVRLAKEKILLTKTKGRITLFSLQSIAEYTFYYQKFKEHYLTLGEVANALNYQNGNAYPSALFERFLYMMEQGAMDVISLDHKINHNEYFISKFNLSNFTEKYISIVEAAKEAESHIDTVKSWIKKSNKSLIYLNKNDNHLIYILQDDWKEILIVGKKTNIISFIKAAKILGLNDSSFETFFKDSKYNVILDEKRGYHYLSLKDFESIKVEQDILWESTIKQYYTGTEAAEKLGILRNTLFLKPYKDSINSIFVPPLICTVRDGISFRNGREKIFLKSDVDEFIRIKEPQKAISTLISSLDTDPYNKIFIALREANTSFSDSGRLTEDYWKKYLKKKYSKTVASTNSNIKAVKVDLNTSKLLIEMTKIKEIFMFTINELNFSIFNADLPKTTKLEANKFLKSIAESRIQKEETIKYKVNSLPNLYLRNGVKTEDKTIYPIEQFVAVINYVKDLNIHKQKSIESINLNKNNQSNPHYDSSWLYVLLHLNNAWRHSDVTLFPRINLNKTRLGDLVPEEALEWITHNDLSPYEMNQIMNQVSAINFIHSKTKKRRYFFCSDELLSAFTHSVVLCELRCRLFNPFSKTLIDFDNKARKFKEIFKNQFFSNFDLDFDFKSKQMNRTLISYIYSVIKKTTNRNPLEVTKYIRSHSSVETTNIYIDIPQEQMDFITNQLFSMGQFGYAYDALGELLLNNASSERDVKTEQSLMIKEVFGDVHQIEHLASYLNRLTNDQNSVRKVLEGYSLEEKENLSQLVKLGQQPAKKEGYQCIYSKCPYPTRDCEKCPFVISHFYALSQLGDDFGNQLEEFKTKFPMTTKEGEKIRLSNNLYSYINLISSAVKRFGADNVESFFNHKLEDIKLELSDIPSVKHLVTISESRKADDN